MARITGIFETSEAERTARHWFDIRLQADGTYRDFDDGRAHPNPRELLPRVVATEDWDDDWFVPYMSMPLDPPEQAA